MNHKFKSSYYTLSLQGTYELTANETVYLPNDALLPTFSNNTVVALDKDVGMELFFNFIAKTLQNHLVVDAKIEKSMYFKTMDILGTVAILFHPDAIKLLPASSAVAAHSDSGRRRKSTIQKEKEFVTLGGEIISESYSIGGVESTTACFSHKVCITPSSVKENGTMEFITHVNGVIISIFEMKLIVPKEYSIEMKTDKTMHLFQAKLVNALVKNKTEYGLSAPVWGATSDINDWYFAKASWVGASDNIVVKLSRSLTFLSTSGGSLKPGIDYHEVFEFLVACLHPEWPAAPKLDQIKQFSVQFDQAVRQVQSKVHDDMDNERIYSAHRKATCLRSENNQYYKAKWAKVNLDLDRRSDLFYQTLPEDCDDDGASEKEHIHHDAMISLEENKEATYWREKTLSRIFPAHTRFVYKRKSGSSGNGVEDVPLGKKSRKNASFESLLESLMKKQVALNGAEGIIDQDGLLDTVTFERILAPAGNDHDHFLLHLTKWAKDKTLGKLAELKTGRPALVKICAKLGHTCRQNDTALALVDFIEAYLFDHSYNEREVSALLQNLIK